MELVCLHCETDLSFLFEVGFSDETIVKNYICLDCESVFEHFNGELAEIFCDINFKKHEE